jgi:hypothetical protein
VRYLFLFPPALLFFGTVAFLFIRAYVPAGIFGAAGLLYAPVAIRRFRRVTGPAQRA